MNAPNLNSPNAGRTAAKSAPKAASWAWAENLVPEADQAAAARAAATPFGISPLSRGTASTLTFLARTVQARAVVEIGTGSGVSGLALFQGMQDDGILTSVDLEPDHQTAARSAFTEHGIRSQRFRLIAGPALNVLPKLSDASYDLVFIDADKIEYPAYVDQAMRLLRSGGLLVMDNALWHGKVSDESNDDDDTAAIREAIAIVTENEDYTTTLLPVGDGLLVAVKR